MSRLAESPVLLLDVQATSGDPARGAMLEMAWAPFAAGEAGGLPLGRVTAHVIAPPPGAVLPRAVARITGLRTADWTHGIDPGQAWDRLRHAVRAFARRRAGPRRHPLRALRGAVPARTPRRSRGAGRSRSTSSARTRSLHVCSRSCRVARCALWPVTSGRVCRRRGAPRTTSWPPRFVWLRLVALLAEREGIDARRARRLAGATGAPRAARLPARAREAARAAGSPRRLPAAARGRDRGVRRQGRLAAPARERALPRPRGPGRARARDADAGARRVLVRHRDRARGGAARGGRDQAAVHRRSTSRSPPPGARSGSRPPTSPSCGSGRVPSTPAGRSCRRLRSRRWRRCAPSSWFLPGAARHARACGGDRAGYAPGPECFAAGLSQFREAYGSDARVPGLLRLGAQLWARRRDAAAAAVAADSPEARPREAEPVARPGTKNA